MSGPPWPAIAAPARGRALGAGSDAAGAIAAGALPIPSPVACRSAKKDFSTAILERKKSPNRLIVDDVSAGARGDGQAPQIAPPPL